MLIHNVYFSLKDKSEASKQKLLAACQQYVPEHAGIVLFSCGTVVPDLVRPVNDRDFDVSLHIVFESRQHHDYYQISPRHEQFIRDNKDNWARVRVFDSTDAPPLPPPG